MEIESITHKGLKRFVETGNAGKLVGDAKRIRLMILNLQAAGSMEELVQPPNFNLHALKGDRAGVWSMTVSRNWRMTFRIADDDVITDLNLEDYHGH